MRFYETNWFLWLSLILFTPLGIFVLWKFHADETPKVKMIVTIIFIVFFVGVLFVGSNVFDKSDKKPSAKDIPKQTETEEKADASTDDETEEVGDLKFLFDKNSPSVNVGDSISLKITNVNERENITWQTEDAGILYVQSAVGNSCELVAADEGETTVSAKSSLGHGEIKVRVKKGSKSVSESVKKNTERVLEKSSLKMGSNFQYDLKVDENSKNILLTFWLEGFNEEDLNELDDNYNVKGMTKVAEDYTKAIQSILENLNLDVDDTTITVRFLNGTNGESYKGINDRTVTNDVLFTLVNGKKSEEQ